jgi:hypothetical protein
LINIFTPKTVLGERIFYENENIFDKKKIKKKTTSLYLIKLDLNFMKK